MRLKDLIEELQEFADLYGDMDVRIATQPRWPFEYTIGTIVAAKDADDADDEDDEDDPFAATTLICGVCEREWSGDTTASRTCPACGNDGDIESHAVRVDDPAAERVVYIGEGTQIGYLSGRAAKMLGWDGDR